MSTPYNPAPDPELLPPGPPPTEPPVPPPASPPWTFREVVFLAFLAIFLVAFFQAIAIGVARVHRPQAPLMTLAQDARVILPPQIVAYLVLLGCMVLLLRSRGLHFWRNLKWNFPSSRWYAFVALGAILSATVLRASSFLPIPKQLPVDQFFADTFSAYMLAVFGITLAPLMEELYFRGFLYPVLERRLGMPTAVLITSGIFALIHASQLGHAWAPLLLLLFVGVALTVARVQTGSVASSFLIHVGYNTTLFAMLFFSTDHFRHLDKMK